MEQVDKMHDDYDIDCTLDMTKSFEISFIYHI